MKLRHACTAVLAAALVAGVAGEAVAAPLNTASTVRYKIETSTGRNPDAGTDATVKIKLYGSAGTSGWLKLDSEYDDHEAAHVNPYEFDLPDLGRINDVDIYFDHSGDSPDWYLDTITVTGSGEHSFFQSYRWFTNEGTVRFTSPASVRARAYWFWVKTGDVDGAGTNSTVEFRVHGENRTTPWLYMDNWYDNSERGVTDLYTHDLWDLGDIERVEVRFDHSGEHADWFLDDITVAVGTQNSPRIGYFPYANWLTKATTISLANRL